MKFSAQEEYGLRCLLAIAKAPEGTSLTIPIISSMEDLSEPHVAKLLMFLRKGGFIGSTRGHTGGYFLLRKPREIVVGDVLESLGGKLYGEGFCDRHSGLSANCVHEGDCAVQFLWQEIQDAVDRVIRGLTLEDLLNRRARPVINGKFHATPGHISSAFGKRNTL